MPSTSAQRQERQMLSVCRLVWARGRMPSQARINQGLFSFKSIFALTNLILDQCKMKIKFKLNSELNACWSQCPTFFSAHSEVEWTPRSPWQAWAQMQYGRFGAKKYCICVFVCKQWQEEAPEAKLSTQTAVSFHVLSKCPSKNKLINKSDRLFGYKNL